MTNSPLGGAVGTALITGASSGIGEAFARRLARDGYDLVLIARRKDRLDALAQELRAGTGVAVDVLVADLSDAGGVATVAERLRSDDRIQMLVNNAGLGLYKPVAETDTAKIEEMITLNVVALALLTRAALPPMVARGRGVIINVSSGLAFIPVATRATYSGTKAFVNNFTQAISEEVKGSGVQMQVLCPAITRTAFHDHSGTDLSQIPPHIIMEADALVDASLAGLKLGEVVCIPALQETGPLENFGAAQSALGQALRQTGTPAPRYTA